MAEYIERGTGVSIFRAKANMIDADLGKRRKPHERREF